MSQPEAKKGKDLPNLNEAYDALITDYDDDEEKERKKSLVVSGCKLVVNYVL